MSIPISLARAGQWFLESGIQEPHGGVARYYRIDQGANARVSTEITGYAVSAFCYLHSQSADSAYLDAARLAGRFLVDQAWDAKLHLFPFEWPETAGPAENRAYFFDCGIIIRGLIRLWRASGEQRYLQRAVECGTRMERVFAHDGHFAPILQLPGAEPLPYGTSWSNNPGCYQLKSALGWRELYLETGEAKFDTWFEQALTLALANQAEFLPGSTDRHRVMDRLHAYAYFLEGLLAVADRAHCAGPLRSGVTHAAALTRDIAPEFARSDVYAQLLRLRLHCAALHVLPLDEVAAREEIHAIREFQINSGDPRTNGGYHFGRRNGEMAAFTNPVSTAFCLQARNMWDVYRQGNSSQETWRDLI